MAILFVGEENNYEAWQKADAAALAFQAKSGRSLAIHKAYSRETALAHLARGKQIYEAAVMVGLKLKAKREPYYGNSEDYGLQVISAAVTEKIPVLVLKPDRKIDVKALKAGASVLVSLRDSPADIAKSLEQIVSR